MEIPRLLVDAHLTSFSALFGMTLWGLLIVGLLIYSAMHFFKMPLKFSIRPLLLNFAQKMWMTAGLGVFFFGLYIALVFFGSMTIDSNLRLDLFFLLYKHPTQFIYLGLFVFACASLLSLFVRMVIKFFYNSKNK